MIIASLRYLFWFGIVFTLLGCSPEKNESDFLTASQDSVITDVIVDNESDSSAIQTGTSDRIAAIQDRLVPKNSPDSEQTDSPKYRLEVPPYNTFLNSAGYLDMLGQSMSDIDAILGAAPIVVRQSIQGAPIRKEIRVYLPYLEDSTGLYLVFENETIIEFKMDEFNGIIQSGILDYLK